MADTITSLAELEALYGEPVPAALRKETTTINPLYKQLIEAAPFFAIASNGPEGMDCSPRGDGVGCVQVEDTKTIIFADRRGNNRLDTLRNIIFDERIGMLFLIPGMNETLRINGRAAISTDKSLLERFNERDKLPRTVVVVTVESVYFQCGKAVLRSKIWDVNSHIDRKTLPSAGALVQSVFTEFDGAAYDAELPERQIKNLY